MAHNSLVSACRWHDLITAKKRTHTDDVLKQMDAVGLIELGLATLKSLLRLALCSFAVKSLCRIQEPESNSWVEADDFARFPKHVEANLAKLKFRCRLFVFDHKREDSGETSSITEAGAE